VESILIQLKENLWEKIQWADGSLFSKAALSKTVGDVYISLTSYYMGKLFASYKCHLCSFLFVCQQWSQRLCSLIHVCILKLLWTSKTSCIAGNTYKLFNVKQIRKIRFVKDIVKFHSPLLLRRIMGSSSKVREAPPAKNIGCSHCHL